MNITLYSGLSFFKFFSRAFYIRAPGSGDWATLSNKLQKLQNRAARVITSSNYDVNVSSLFHKLSWKDFKCQRQIQNALMVFKSLNGLVREYLTSKFIERNE